jgi:hypothetical protein
MLTFFGLGPNYRPQIYDQIFDLMYYGNMGFNFTELYNMPVFLRNYYYRKLVDVKKKEKERHDAEVDKINSQSSRFRKR